MANISVTLHSPTDLAGFRVQARHLLLQNMAPDQVDWHVAGSATPDLFAFPAPDAGDADAISAFTATSGTGNTGNLALCSQTDASITPVKQVQVPPAFLALCKTALLHADPNRFSLLYRLLWRLVHDRHLRHDPLDPDRMRAEDMVRAVRRDMHKMKAFVRFRILANADDAGGPLHVAWFEPTHQITEAIAPFFVRRFTQMRWSILTPQKSIFWDGQALTVGPGAKACDAPPPDAGEALWLTYYANIFNPARLKLKMMQKEMPRRYWHNLPEAQLISELSARALERTSTMIVQPGTTPTRRIPKHLSTKRH